MTTPSKDYTADAPPRDQVDATKGVQVLEFGTGWCGICAAAQPKIAAAFAQHAGIPHLKVEMARADRWAARSRSSCGPR